MSCERPARAERRSAKPEPSSPGAAIEKIFFRVVGGRARRSLAAPAVAAALLLAASDASAERVSLLDFEGEKAVSLRWRVASALKRAGHTVLGVSPPKDPEDTDQLRAYAQRRRIDVFLSGASVGGSDGWELTLTLRNADGDRVGRELTLSAPTLREMIREIKGDGLERLDSAVSGGGSASPIEDDGSERASREKRRGDGASGQRPRRSRAVEEPIDLDADEPDGSASADDEDVSFDADEGADEAAGRDDEPADGEAKAEGWATSDDDSAPADDGRESFLAEGSDADEEVGVDSGEDGSEGAGAAADPTVVLGLNAGFVRRTLSYSDDIYGRLRAPAANAWVYRLQAAIYPFARPLKNRVGLIAGYESEFSGVVRDDLAGTDFPVSLSELYGGLKLRQPLGAHEIALQGTVATMQSGLDDPDGRSGVPEFDYTSLRAALDVGLRFGGLALKGSVGYRLPLGGYGEAADANWFPRMEGYGVEAAAGLTYQISKEVAFDVSTSVRRFLLQMNSQPADALAGVSEVAGGAVDLYLGGYFGLNIIL